MVPKPETSEVAMANNVLTWEAVKARGVAGLPVLFPIIELADKFAILVKDTAPLPIAVKPVLSIEMSPVIVTPVATFEPLPTNILADVKVFVSLADKEALRSV